MFPALTRLHAAQLREQSDDRRAGDRSDEIANGGYRNRRVRVQAGATSATATTSGGSGSGVSTARRPYDYTRSLTRTASSSQLEIVREGSTDSDAVPNPASAETAFPQVEQRERGTRNTRAERHANVTTAPMNVPRSTRSGVNADTRDTYTNGVNAGTRDSHTNHVNGGYTYTNQVDNERSEERRALLSRRRGARVEGQTEQQQQAPAAPAPVSTAPRDRRSANVMRATTRERETRRTRASGQTRGPTEASAAHHTPRETTEGQEGVDRSSFQTALLDDRRRSDPRLSLLSEAERTGGAVSFAGPGELTDEDIFQLIMSEDAAGDMAEGDLHRLLEYYATKAAEREKK